jgi:hypothetical protein
VLVYQMGQVGSTSIATSLEDAGIAAFHVHRINPACIRHYRQALEGIGLGNRHLHTDAMGEVLFNDLIQPGHRTAIVTLVREPISHRISFYFQSLDALFQTHEAHRHVPLERLLAEFQGRSIFSRELAWFDEEFAPVTGIDVYQHPFPVDEGFHRIRTDRFDVLVMRHDLDDELKRQCLVDLTGVPSIVLRRRNEAARKPYSAVYDEFRRRLRVLPEQADQMLESKYARHFFRPEELREARRRWSAEKC